MARTKQVARKSPKGKASGKKTKTHVKKAHRYRPGTGKFNSELTLQC